MIIKRVIISSMASLFLIGCLILVSSIIIYNDVLRKGFENGFGIILSRDSLDWSKVFFIWVISSGFFYLALEIEEDI